MFRKLVIAGIALIAFGNPAHSDEQTIKILFVGDLMLDEVPGKIIKFGGNPFHSFSPLFKQADVRIGNLECVISKRGKAEEKPYTFRAHPRVTKLLKTYFNAVSLANNHTGDYGPLAFSDMLDILDRSDISYFGGGRNLRSAHQPYLIDVKGKRIAILGYNEFFPRSFEALTDRAGTAWSDDDYVTYDIKKAKHEYKADIVIVYPHWGWEYEKFASPRQEKLAHLMIDAGADAVVGGHPHVTENIEIYREKPIFYSLGNFVFNGFEDAEATTGWALELNITAEARISWKVHVAKLDKDGIPKYFGDL